MEWMSILGTIAFSISGVMLGIRKDMDLFGVVVMAITTACGGGVVRDILVGNTPPIMFQDPKYVLIAFVSATIAFYLTKYNYMPTSNIYENILFTSDTLGLAAFSVTGVSVGMQFSQTSVFLSVFLGVITACGGGVLRDVMAQEMPQIFMTNIYAIASIIGSTILALMWQTTNNGYIILFGFLIIVMIRMLSVMNEWNLPHAK